MNQPKPPKPQAPAAKQVAVATLPSDARDVMGDTLGSFSGMALQPGSWRKSIEGFQAKLVVLPDRGFNTPAKGEYSDYPARTHTLDVLIKNSGAVSVTYEKSRYIRDANGALTTGLDPRRGTMAHLGHVAPSPEPQLETSLRRLSLDAEGIAIRSDGSFYVSDEFSCSIYYCDVDGRMRGVIPAGPALSPQKKKRPHFTSNDDDVPDTGRQPNDGIEGLSLTPDGKTLFALMQSPLVQDITENAATNRYVRLLTFNVAKSPCPKGPTGHYVVELPLYASGSDDVPDKPVEANCILPLDHERFLLLARDGRGFGSRKKIGMLPIRFKKILLGHLDPHANLKSTEFAQGTKSVIRNGMLRENISALKLTEFVDVCDEGALNAVGLTLHPNKHGLQQLSAKWESLCLSPPLSPRSSERFLFVGNDNDFLTRNGYMPDRAYDAGIDSPNMILVYRIMIPEMGSPKIAAVSKT